MLNSVVNSKFVQSVFITTIATRLFFGGMVDAVADEFFVRVTIKDQYGEVVPYAQFSVTTPENNVFSGDSGFEGKLEIEVSTETAVEDIQAPQNSLKVYTDSDLIHYTLIKNAKVNLYTIGGQRIRSFDVSKGSNSLQFPKGLGSGAYIYKFLSPDFNGTARVTVIEGDITGGRVYKFYDKVQSPMFASKIASPNYLLEGSKEGFQNFSEWFDPANKYTSFDDAIVM